MTSDRRLEHDLPELLAQLAPRATPDYRDHIVRQTASVNQRPVWMFPERWFPVDLTLTPPRGRFRPRPAVIALGLVALLIAAALIAYVGTRVPRVPAPFGPADNGAIFYSSGSGDIFTADSVTATPRLLVGGLPFDRSPMPSRDGRRVAFVRLFGSNAVQVVVADADGSDLRVLDGSYRDYESMDWSPDGSRLAVVSNVGGMGAISILQTDGTGSKALSMAVEPHEFHYLPDGRLVFQGVHDEPTGTTYGIYTANADGSDVRKVLAAETDGDFIGLGISPNGQYVIGHRWRGTDEQGRLVIGDLQSGQEHMVLPVGMTPEEEHEGAQFSPDSTLVLYTRYTASGNTLSVVPAAGGPSTDIGEITASNTSPVASFSPDGKSVIAYYPDDHHLWLLDATGATKGQQLDLPVSDAPAWQRAAH